MTDRLDTATDAPDEIASVIDLDTAPRWLTPEQAARAVQVSRRTIDRWARQRLIRSTRPAGGSVRIDRDSLRDLLDRHATGPRRSSAD